MIMCFLVILAVLLQAFLAWKSEPSIRVSGYVLQLLGMVFAIRGLLSVRKHFGQLELRVLFFHWLRQFPKWKRNTVIGVAAGKIGLTGMKARVEVWASDDPQKSIEERIKAIVRNQDQIRSELRQHFNSIDYINDMLNEHKKETEKRDNELHDSLREELESLHTGDFLVTLTGLIWLTVGITLSTLSLEISRWIN